MEDNRQEALPDDTNEAQSRLTGSNPLSLAISRILQATQQRAQSVSAPANSHQPSHPNQAKKRNYRLADLKQLIVDPNTEELDEEQQFYYAQNVLVNLRKIIRDVLITYERANEDNYRPDSYAPLIDQIRRYKGSMCIPLNEHTQFIITKIQSILNLALSCIKKYKAYDSENKPITDEQSDAFVELMNSITNFFMGYRIFFEGLSKEYDPKKKSSANLALLELKENLEGAQDVFHLINDLSYYNRLAAERYCAQVGDTHPLVIDAMLYMSQQVNYTVKQQKRRIEEQEDSSNQEHFEYGFVLRCGPSRYARNAVTDSDISLSDQDMEFIGVLAHFVGEEFVGLYQTSTLATNLATINKAPYFLRHIADQKIAMMQESNIFPENNDELATGFIWAPEDIIRFVGIDIQSCPLFMTTEPLKTIKATQALTQNNVLALASETHQEKQKKRNLQQTITITGSKKQSGKGAKVRGWAVTQNVVNPLSSLKRDRPESDTAQKEAKTKSSKDNGKTPEQNLEKYLANTTERFQTVRDFMVSMMQQLKRNISEKTDCYKKYFQLQQQVSRDYLVTRIKRHEIKNPLSDQERTQYKAMLDENFCGSSRGYQVEDVLRLLENARNGIGTILCHEMGLGKTVIAGMFVLAKFLEAQNRRPISTVNNTLIVVPQPVLEQWNSALINLCGFSGRRNKPPKPVKWHGERAARAFQINQFHSIMKNGQPLITTIDVMKNDINSLPFFTAACGIIKNDIFENNESLPIQGSEAVQEATKKILQYLLTKKVIQCIVKSDKQSAQFGDIVEDEQDVFSNLFHESPGNIKDLFKDRYLIIGDIHQPGLLDELYDSTPGFNDQYPKDAAITLLNSIKLFDGVIFDESHDISNNLSNITSSYAFVVAYGIAKRGGFRVGLSGTPIPNKLSELWGAHELLNPGSFWQKTRLELAWGNLLDKPFRAMKDVIGNIHAPADFIQTAVTEIIHSARILQEFIRLNHTHVLMRRTRNDCVSGLADQEIPRITVQHENYKLTDAQKKLYQRYDPISLDSACRRYTFSSTIETDKGQTASESLSLGNRQNEEGEDYINASSFELFESLKRINSHPWYFEEWFEKWLEENDKLKNKPEQLKDAFKKLLKNRYNDDQTAVNNCIALSGKLLKLWNLLGEIVERDEAVHGKAKPLIFVHHISDIALVHYIIEMKFPGKFEVLHYHGGLRAEQKTAVQISFNKEYETSSTTRIMIATDGVGAEGVEFLASDVIITVPPWNDSALQQLFSRAIRPQNPYKNIKAHLFVGDNPFDKKCFDFITNKKEWSKALIDRKMFMDNDIALGEIRDLEATEYSTEAERQSAQERIQELTLKMALRWFHNMLKMHTILDVGASGLGFINKKAFLENSADAVRQLEESINQAFDMVDAALSRVVNLRDMMRISTSRMNRAVDANQSAQAMEIDQDDVVIFGDEPNDLDNQSAGVASSQLSKDSGAQSPQKRIKTLDQEPRRIRESGDHAALEFFAEMSRLSEAGGVAEVDDSPESELELGRRTNLLYSSESEPAIKRDLDRDDLAEQEVQPSSAKRVHFDSQAVEPMDLNEDEIDLDEYAQQLEQQHPQGPEVHTVSSAHSIPDDEIDLDEYAAEVGQAVDSQIQTVQSSAKSSISAGRNPGITFFATPSQSVSRTTLDTNESGKVNNASSSQQTAQEKSKGWSDLADYLDL